ncbi:hypothetical protein J0X19_13205 [Hymenobacter sp. BT186]|uniref:DUF2029 domain-containing protein n=1 Tax=Hymenobacter telluris TaxID=2816474 RepID=A0A939EXC5_9BACT|nr:hypothetical protein [Hymenobacter telluris]MBO0358909.1 hypothetical protein [Hymenobacter telluris]MBW3374935.1 hypothetical protein [Hymenobacter norwichensis]
MPTLRIRLLHALVLLLSALAYAALAYATPRPHFGQLAGLMAVAFGLYVVLLKTGLPLRAGLLAALLLRLLWLPALPAFSDDYHRFRWDGLLVAQGVNPYQYRPDELVAEASTRRALTPAADSLFGKSPVSVKTELTVLYPKLNSPHYYSVYPPVCQLVYGMAAGLFPTNEQGAVLLMRLVLLLAEGAMAVFLIRLLRAFQLPAHRALWYLLNPLVLVELTGNLHFEGLMICLTLLALWLLVRGRWQLSAGALGLAVGTKLLPLLLLPLLVRRLGWRRTILYGVLAALTLLLIFLPFVSLDLLRNISRSLTLYFSKFEFNASVYYVLRAIGYRITTYNEIARIGPALALLTTSFALGLAWREKPLTWARLPRTLLLMLAVYYFNATVVHPWYLVPLVALSVFTPYRFALVWSGLVVLSYAAYQTSAYTENLGLLALEYLVVLAVLVWDMASRGKIAPLPVENQSARA